jgi:hypothetical protein
MYWTGAACCMYWTGAACCMYWTGAACWTYEVVTGGAYEVVRGAIVESISWNWLADSVQIVYGLISGQVCPGIWAIHGYPGLRNSDASEYLGI